jgi:hypothetical protein
MSDMLTQFLFNKLEQKPTFRRYVADRIEEATKDYRIEINRLNASNEALGNEVEDLRTQLFSAAPPRQ